MIVILDCYLILSYALGNKLYQVSKILGHRHLCRLVEPANIYTFTGSKNLLHFLGFTYGQYR